MFSAIRRSLAQFIADDCLSLAAALAYYTLFAMPPLLFLLVTIVSWGMSAAYEQELASERAQRFLQQQAANLIGNEAAGQEIGSIIRNSQQQSGAGWKSLLSLVGVLVGATGLVGALQAALNRVWRVKPAEGRLAARFLMKRLLSLALILAF
ncbi:MAG: YihY/virulence factor BrkB family protein, partial [Planctomycetales bacterium]|nr:YihY/virulence factor BrkB family protein [Planctomycetales bacterium]